MLQIVIDDSGRGQERRPAFVLAGHIAPVRNWEAFADRWQNALREKPAIGYLKGSEAFRRQGEFRGWSEEKRDKKVLRLISLIHQFSPFSIRLAINGSEFEAILRATKGSLRTIYPIALAAISTRVLSYQAHQRTFEKLDFVFDEGILSRAVDFEKAFEEMCTALPIRVIGLLGKRPHMENDLKFVPLQAADLVASYLRYKLAFEARGEVFQNVIWTAFTKGRKNLDASLTQENLFGLRKRLEREIAKGSRI